MILPWSWRCDVNQAKHYKLKRRIDELTENFCCWELASCFSYCVQEFLNADHVLSEVFFVEMGEFTGLLSSIYFHITHAKLWMKCDELSWSPGHCTVLDGLQRSSKIPSSSLHPAWQSMLLLICFTVWSVKTEGHPRSCRRCCQDSKQWWHSLCNALWETGAKDKHRRLLKTFWFGLLHHVESVWCCIWFSFCASCQQGVKKTCGGFFCICAKSN